MRRSILFLAAIFLALSALVGRTDPLSPRPQSARPQSRAEVKGLKVAYLDTGTGSPLLLVHGLSTDSRSFEPILSGLASAGFRALAVDLPGYGASDPAAGASSIELCRDALAGFIESLGLGKAVAIGHSMGGLVALALALERPDLVSRLVLIAPGVYGPIPASYIEAYERGYDDAEGRKYEVEDEAVAYFHSIVATWNEDLERMLAGRLAEMREPRWARVRPVIKENALSSLRINGAVAGGLDRLCVPTLLILGERDPLVPPAMSTRIFGARADIVETRILKGVGHLPQYEDPVRLLEEMVSFLGGHY